MWKINLCLPVCFTPKYTKINYFISSGVKPFSALSQSLYNSRLPLHMNSFSAMILQSTTTFDDSVYAKALLANIIYQSDKIAQNTIYSIQKCMLCSFFYTNWYVFNEIYTNLGIQSRKLLAIISCGNIVSMFCSCRCCCYLDHALFVFYSFFSIIFSLSRSRSHCLSIQL